MQQPHRSGYFSHFSLRQEELASRDATSVISTGISSKDITTVCFFLPKNRESEMNPSFFMR